MPTLVERAAAQLPQELLDLGNFFGIDMNFDRKGRAVPPLVVDMLSALEPGYERVGDNYFTGRFGLARVSTVWLGLDQSGGRTERPLIFETMIFSDAEALNERLWRYPTLREAEIGHRRICRLVKLLQREPRVIVKPRKRRHWR